MVVDGMLVGEMSCRQTNIFIYFHFLIAPNPTNIKMFFSEIQLKTT